MAFDNSLHSQLNVPAGKYDVPEENQRSTAIWEALELSFHGNANHMHYQLAWPGLSVWSEEGEMRLVQVSAQGESNQTNPTATLGTGNATFKIDKVTYTLKGASFDADNIEYAFKSSLSEANFYDI